MPGLSTADEPTTEPGFCRSTDGRLFATADQVRRCLKDEATAARVADALALAGVSTAKANQEMGRRLQAEDKLEAERATSDERLVAQVELVQENDRLRRRPRGWQVVVVAAAAIVVGGAIGYGVGQLK